MLCSSADWITVSGKSEDVVNCLWRLSVIQVVSKVPGFSSGNWTAYLRSWKRFASHPKGFFLVLNSVPFWTVFSSKVSSVPFWTIFSSKKVEFSSVLNYIQFKKVNPFVCLLSVSESVVFCCWWVFLFLKNVSWFLRISCQYFLYINTWPFLICFLFFAWTAVGEGFSLFNHFQSRLTDWLRRLENHKIKLKIRMVKMQ